MPERESDPLPSPIDARHADAPQTDVPQTDVPQTDVPQTDVPQTDVPQTDAVDRDTRFPVQSSTDPRLRILLAVVALWGLILAVGATGFRVGLFDLRRSAIVLGCFASFLAFWWIMLTSRRRRLSASTAGVPARVAPADPREPPVSRAAGASIVSLALAGACWIAAILLWPATRWYAVVLGWLAGSIFAVAGVAALVALSDPRPIRGRRWALLALGGTIAAVIGMFLRARGTG